VKSTDQGPQFKVQDPRLVVIRRLGGQPRADAAEWRAIEELCCRTGDDGQEIARERWEFFARVWIGPYKKLRPEWTCVAIAGGEIVGYLTGCPDTPAFARAKFWRNTLPLLLEIAAGRYRRGNKRYRRLFVRRSLRLESWPEQEFPDKIRAQILASFPAHLHMNVDLGHRRAGVGSRLLERYLTDLESSGVGGVHLYCGNGPLEFYRRHGFTELESIFFRGTPVYALARPTAK
jgi:GNAT superfamily N-acetyltransferase